MKQDTESHPHGCVSWNGRVQATISVTFKSHPHGCVSWNYDKVRELEERKVTPSRVCELKFWEYFDKII